MRLFFAILLSPQMEEALFEGIQQIRQQTGRGSFSRRENLHLTLAFLGETEAISAAVDAMNAIDCHPFVMELQGSGRFGETVWAGIKPCDELNRLAEELQSQLRRNGFRLEKRPFRPHITLARRIDPEAALHIRLSPCSMQTNHIALMCSERIAGRLTYTEIAGRNF